MIRAPIRSAAETLDWNAFRARVFPGPRDRHDFEALVAYGAYRQEDERRRTGRPSGDETDVRTRSNGLAEPSARLSAWENEGGAALS